MGDDDDRAASRSARTGSTPCARCSRRSWSGARSRSRRSSYGKVEDAAGGTVRQTATLNAGISSDNARKLNKFIKGLGLKGIQSQTQGDQLRVSGKKRDDLQAVIAALKEHDFGIPLQFNNFRD